MKSLRTTICVLDTAETRPAVMRANVPRGTSWEAMGERVWVQFRLENRLMLDLTRFLADIDECLETVCGPEEICVNLRGGHKCYHVECPANYIRDSEHKT